PDVASSVTASTLGYLQGTVATPSSFNGSTDVTTVMQNLADRAGLKLESNGVSIKLSNQYLSGSLADQITRTAEAADLLWAVDKGVLTMWQRGTSRSGKVPLISPQSGMWGYPIYTQFGVIVKTIFNPDVQFGGQIEVQSQLTPANGKWMVMRLAHDLESNVPGGQW